MLCLLGEEIDTPLGRKQDRCKVCGFLFCVGADSAMPVAAAALPCGMASKATQS